MSSGKKPKIKGIIFDMGGVVVSNDVIEYVISNAAKYYGVERRRIIKFLEQSEKGRHKFGWDEDSYWARFSKSIKSTKQPRQFWTENYGKVTMPNKDLAGFIKKLKGRYKIAVLSNTCQPHINSNSRKGFYSLFDAKIFSCNPEINSEKPGMKIYKACLRKLGLKAGECIYVDDVKRYLIPARKLGMKTIHFKDVRQLKTGLARLGVDVK